MKYEPSLGRRSSRQVSILLIAIASIVISGGCGTSSAKGAVHTAAGSASPPTYSRSTTPALVNPNTSVELVPPESINALVSDSDSGVVATVTAISSPRWNSPDGSEWEADPNNPDFNAAAPILYRSITVDVQTVMFADTALPVSPGQSVTFLSYGDGTNSGAAMNDNPSDRWNQIDGPFATGDNAILLLKMTSFPFEQGPQSEIVLTQNRNAHWTEVGSTAESPIPGRAVDATSLVSRIVSERAAGRQVESPTQQQSTAIDPLG